MLPTNTPVYPNIMYLTYDTMTDTAMRNGIRHLLSRCTPQHIYIEYDVSKIDFPIRANIITLSYNAHTTRQLLELRRFIAISHTQTIIIQGTTNLVDYLRENTIEKGGGLFGAMLYNKNIHTLIIRDMNTGSGSKEGTSSLKQDMKKEQKIFRRTFITPTKKIKIRFD
jgi:hypothetical protein